MTLIRNKQPQSLSKNCASDKNRYFRESGIQAFSIPKAFGTGWGACPVLDTGGKPEDEKPEFMDRFHMSLYKMHFSLPYIF